MLCEHGHGVTQSLKEARRHYLMAVELGLTEASGNVKRVEEEIREEIMRKLGPMVRKRVVIVGTSRRDLNGRAGVATSFDSSRGRYVVELDLSRR